MSDEAIKLRRGRPEDAAMVAEFAARMFDEAFGADNDPADLARHLATAFGAVQQESELRDVRYRTLLMEDTHGRLCAFAQVRQTQPPACVSGANPVELYRCYVDRSWHGRGVARQLMDGVFEAARELEGRSLWLSVWERNPRAIRFYEKCGFRTAGSTTFVVGTDSQRDLVMVADDVPGSN
jgi:diamine N-acetyltransferase